MVFFCSDGGKEEGTETVLSALFLEPYTGELMTIIIVGAGKLAAELLDGLPGKLSAEVSPWTDADPTGATTAQGPCVVVHAGSGRQLESVVSYCDKTASTLIELATGSAIAKYPITFPVVVCPNTNILMLKFMAMLATSGHHFKDYTVRVVESHQAGKSSVPGTAVSMARSLGVQSDQIRSIRDPQEQREALQIPAEHFARHAYHHIEIEDSACRLSFETRVYGPAPYAEGVAHIVHAVCTNALENRRYDIMDFIEYGWL